MDGGDEHPDSDVEMPHLEEMDDAEEHQHDDDAGEEEEEDAGELEAHYDDDAEEHLDEEEAIDEGGQKGEEDVEEEEEEAQEHSEDPNSKAQKEDVEDEEEFDEEAYEQAAPSTNPNHESDEEGMSDEEEQDKPENSESAINNNNRHEAEDTDASDGAKRKRSASHSSVDEEGPKRKQVRSSGSVSGTKHDTYCWVCHKDGVQTHCKICPRSYHSKCMHASEDGKQTQPESPTKPCICPECAIVMNAENLETRSETMKNLTIDQLITMLKYACQRMKSTPGAEPFYYPVDPGEAVDYFQFIVYPMDLTTLENNVKKREYGSTEAFLADAQWIVHNSVVFNSVNSPFTAAARKVLKVCRQEIQDIETCPECYVNAHDKPTVWFVEACRRPHILVWAKLKGFPFWPAKAMKIKDEMVDVRFFGAHDRAWVVRSGCYLYSEQNPGVPPKKNPALATSIEELNAHVEKLRELHGPIIFPTDPKTRIGPQLSLEHIREMLPEYTPEDPPVAKTPTGGAVQSAKKSPMTIRISSLKTNPTIVTNTVVEESETAQNAKSKLRSKDSPAVSDSNNDTKPEPSVENDEEGNPDEEEPEPENSAEEEGNHPLSTEQAKPSGILATALAGPTRRSSRSETGSTSPAAATMLRAVLKQDKAESGGEEGARDATPPPPKSFLSSLGLMKSSEVVKTKKPIGTTSQLGKLLHPSEVFVKQEENQQDEDEDYGDANHGRSGGGPSRKPNEMGNQGGGMRFNLSKDISISPVAGDESGEDHHHQSQQQQPRRLIQGHSARLVPGLIPQNSQMMGVGGVRPNRQMMTTMNNNGGGMRMQQHQQGQQGQQRVMMRPRPGAPMRPGMRMNGPPRPQSMQMMQQMKSQQHQQQHGQKLKDGSSNMMIDSSSLQAQGAFTNAVQLNQVHSIQGAVTLPGGTITVTPLQPVIGVTEGGQMVLKQNISSNGLPISVLAPQGDGGAQSLLKSNNKPNPQRRNLMNQVPSSVGHLVQNLQKNLVESVKSTMEQIVVEMIEKANSSGGGPEAKALKDENERLKKQVGEFKHNQDSVTRELKEALMADKKRALTELRKQLELEKNKAIEETKKRQWCARCSREAQFYCCWNTSYCGYSCQEEHWPSHMNSCSQSSGGGRQ